MAQNAFLAVGKIVGAHGIRGAVKVYSYLESAAVLKPNTPLVARDRHGWEESVVVQWAKPHKRTIRMALKGIGDRNAAEALMGAELFIAKENLPELERGCYYWAELIGLDVFATDGAYLGRIVSIMPTGSNDVYVVENPAQGSDGELLIPALESVIVEVDLAAGMMRVDLPEGLL